MVSVVSSSPTGGNFIFLRHLDDNFVQKWQKCQICVIYENFECICCQMGNTSFSHTAFGFCHVSLNLLDSVKLILEKLYCEPLHLRNQSYSHWQHVFLKNAQFFGKQSCCQNSSGDAMGFTLSLKPSADTKVQNRGINGPRKRTDVVQKLKKGNGFLSLCFELIVVAVVTDLWQCFWRKDIGINWEIYEGSFTSSFVML